jgi:hypothetical protein
VIIIIADSKAESFKQDHSGRDTRSFSAISGRHFPALVDRGHRRRLRREGRRWPKACVSIMRKSPAAIIRQVAHQRRGPAGCGQRVEAAGAVAEAEIIRKEPERRPVGANGFALSPIDSAYFALGPEHAATSVALNTSNDCTESRHWVTGSGATLIV